MLESWKRSTGRLPVPVMIQRCYELEGDDPQATGYPQAVCTRLSTPHPQNLVDIQHYCHNILHDFFLTTRFLSVTSSCMKFLFPMECPFSDCAECEETTFVLMHRGVCPDCGGLVVGDPACRDCGALGKGPYVAVPARAAEAGPRFYGQDDFVRDAEQLIAQIGDRMLPEMQNAIRSSIPTTDPSVLVKWGTACLCPRYPEDITCIRLPSLTRA